MEFTTPGFGVARSPNAGLLSPRPLRSASVMDQSEQPRSAPGFFIWPRACGVSGRAGRCLIVGAYRRGRLASRWLSEPAYKLELCEKTAILAIFSLPRYAFRDSQARCREEDRRSGARSPGRFAPTGSPIYRSRWMAREPPPPNSAGEKPANQGTWGAISHSFAVSDRCHEI